MANRRYEQLYDEQGIELESGKPIRFACCDCGLVHDMVIVSADSKPVGFAVRTNRRSTAGRRRFVLRNRVITAKGFAPSHTTNKEK